uniref:TM2 domain-containing protein n=1 Tax=Rhodococcus sp. H36-A4 TaxID=3004353 RepID=UPI003FA793E9
MSEPDKKPESGSSDEGSNNETERIETERIETPPDFGTPFDYDATAEASLSEQPATSETGPMTGAIGSGSGSGPGWAVHSGIGNGPGWGESPSYPPPTAPDPASDNGPGSGVSFDKPNTAPSYGDTSPEQSFGASPYGQPGPVYGAPDPGYPQPNPNDQYYDQYQGGGYGPPPSGPPPGGFPPPPGYQPQQGYPPLPGYQPQPAYGGYPGATYGVDPMAPYGRHPVTGEPFSDRSKLTAGLLGILLGAFGAGRFYLNQPGMAVAQIAVTWLTCGIGGIWPLIDGIMMLTGSVRDQHGRPLRD